MVLVLSFSNKTNMEQAVFLIPSFIEDIPSSFILVAKVVQPSHILADFKDLMSEAVKYFWKDTRSCAMVAVANKCSWEASCKAKLSKTWVSSPFMVSGNCDSLTAS